MTGNFKKTFFNYGILLTLIIFLLGCDSPRLKDGQRLYNAGQYEEALTHYRQLLSKDPDSPIINYHAGIALYKKGDYEKTIEHHLKVLTTENSDLEARAIYNIGNCKFRQAEERQKKDWEGSIGLYQEASQYYQRSLELNEKDEEAKFNIGLVEKKLRNLLSQPQKQKAGTQKALDKKTEDGEPPSTKDPFSSSENLSAKGTDSLSRNQQDHQPKREGRKAESSREGRPIKGKRIEMSKEEAEKFLEAFQQEEESGMLSKNGKRRGHDSKIGKDW